MKINTIAGLFAALLIVFTSACKQGFKTTDEGLQYMYLVESDTGEVAGEGGYLKMNIQMKTSTDSMITNTYDEKQGPAEMLVAKPTYEGCIYGGFAMLKAGDSVVFKVVADSLYIRTFNSSLPPFLKAGEELTIIVSVLESKSKETFEKKQNEDKAKKAEDTQKIMAADVAALEEAAAKLGVKDQLQRTPSGLMYAVIKGTNGKTAVNGDVAGFFYRGTFVDGKEFDSNIGKEPFTVMVGQGGAIAGWMEVADKIKLGEKWLLFVPSSLAYGEQGGGPIGPNTPLVFEMELNSIKTAEQVKKEEEARALKMANEEKQKVTSYLQKKNYKNLQKLSIDDGTISYVMEREGTGATPQVGDIVKVKIRGFDLDGGPIKTFTMEEPPVEGPVDQGMLPMAMDKVLMKMKKGGMARVITASKFFQGEAGGGAIPPYTPIMFEMELIDFSKPAPQGAAPGGAPQGGK